MLYCPAGNAVVPGYRDILRHPQPVDTCKARMGPPKRHQGPTMANPVVIIGAVVQLITPSPRTRLRSENRA